MPTVTVLYFAQAAERSGCAGESLVLPSVCDPAGIRLALAERHPALAELLAHCRFALDQQFINGPITLRDGSELAVIPPVSGG